MSARLRVVVADDHPLVRGGIEAALARDASIEIAGSVGSGEEAVEVATCRDADVVLMDLEMPGLGGLAAIVELTKRKARARILVLTSYDGDENIHRALAAGASGYLLKTTPAAKLLEAVRAVAAGGRAVPPEVAARLAERVEGAELTARELEVLEELARGLSNREIAARLGVAESTVKTFVLGIYGKLQVEDRTQAVTVGLRRGLVRLG